MRKMNKKKKKQVIIAVAIFLALITMFSVAYLTATDEFDADSTEYTHLGGSQAIGRISKMLSVPAEVLPGQIVTVRVKVYNDGEAGMLYCKWINVDTGIQLAEQTLSYPAGRGATFTRSITVPQDQTGTFNIMAEVGHDSVVDDTETLNIPVTIVAHRVFVTVLENNTNIPILGAVVHFGAEQKNTDYRGKVEFVVSPGVYGVMIRHPDYWTYSTAPEEQVIVSNSDISLTYHLDIFEPNGGNGDNGDNGENGIPGFEMLAFIVAIGIAFIYIRKRRRL